MSKSYPTNVKHVYTRNPWCSVIRVGETYCFNERTVKVCRLWCVPEGGIPHCHSELENGELVSIYNLSE